MKRFLVFLLAAAFVMAAGNALAQGPTGTEVDVWYWDGTKWVAQDRATPELYNARLFTDGKLVLDSCNKQYWEVPVTISASIAQWIWFRLDWDQWEWYVRKPGIYAGNCIQACISSNGDVGIDFKDFADLLPSVAGNNPIPVYYAHDMGGDPIANNGPWYTPQQLNDGVFELLDEFYGDQLHYGQGLCWKLFNKIEVVECNSACDYTNAAIIALTLNNQKEWIDWKSGGWWDITP